MQWLKVVALILGSAWFFPVSCTSTLYAGMQLIAHLDEREVGRGDQLHSGFSVAVLPGVNGARFRLLALTELHRFRVVGEQYALWLPQASDYLQVNDYAHISYQVLEQNDGVQMIEVADSNDDRTRWSRYRTTGSTVTPLASRMFHVGYMMNALPYAFGIALILHGIGLWLRRRVARVISNE